MIGNRFTAVPIERIRGIIEGVDFGYNVHVVARSPIALLIWSGGTAYTSGRRTCYGSSKMYGYPSRARAPGNVRYNRIGESGGRLSAHRILKDRGAILKIFDEDMIEALRDAVRMRQTLLIEGGGPRLPPSPRLGPDAYHEWQQEPNRGFFCEAKP